jgi:hypothetical protein
MGDMVMGKCEDKQIKSFHVLKQTINISKEDVEDYNVAMYTHVMDFFKEQTNFLKLILTYFFTCLVNNLSTKDLVTLGNLLST